VVVTTILSLVLGFQAAGGKVVGEIPIGLPGVVLPEFDMQTVVKMATAAITISLIGFMEAIAIAKAMAAETRQRLDTNQELFGQGLSNIASGMFGAYPVSGSFSRSAVNISAGARTGFSSIVTGGVVAITLLFLTPLLYHLPQATLAAVIIMAVVNLVKIEPIRHAMKVQVHDGVVAIVTFVLTLVLAPHLEKAIIVGVVLSLGLFLYRTMRPRFAELSLHADGTFRDAQRHALERCADLSVLRFDGSLYFANAGYFESQVLENVASKPDMRYVILDLEGVNQIDATGEEVIRTLHERLKAGGVDMLLARAKAQTMRIFKKSGLQDEFGAEHFFRTRTDAIEYAHAQQLDKNALEGSPLNPHLSVRRTRA
jgi:SulP family sulfate permease